MTNEADNQAARDEEYAEKVRSARARGLVGLVITLVVVGVIYRCSVSDAGLPVASCKTDGDCAGTYDDHVCVSAPTGSYCSRACNADDECSSSYVCDVPGWTPGKTDKLCLHDSQHIGK